MSYIVNKMNIIEDSKILKYLLKTYKRDYGVYVFREPNKVINEVSLYKNADTGCKRKRE